VFDRRQDEIVMVPVRPQSHGSSQDKPRPEARCTRTPREPLSACDSGMTSSSVQIIPQGVAVGSRTPYGAFMAFSGQYNSPSDASGPDLVLSTSGPTKRDATA
jgi:hypothetical protein